MYGRNPLHNIDHLLGDDLHGDYPGVVEEQVQTEDEIRVFLTELPASCRNAVKISRIEQAFLFEGKGVDTRIRRESVVGGDTEYTMTTKFRPLKQESEKEISPEMFTALWPECSKHQKKTRYEFADGWIIDDIGGHAYVAEYELEDGERRPTIPREWSVDRARPR